MQDTNTIDLDSILRSVQPQSSGSTPSDSFDLDSVLRSITPPPIFQQRQEHQHAAALGNIAQTGADVLGGAERYVVQPTAQLPGTLVAGALNLPGRIGVATGLLPEQYGELFHPGQPIVSIPPEWINQAVQATPEYLLPASLKPAASGIAQGVAGFAEGLSTPEMLPFL